VTNGIGDDSAFGAVTPPLNLSSNFTFEGFERPRQYDYTRSGNPTRDLLADTIAQLEGGAGAVVVSTGMAAVDLSIASLGPGDLIVAPHDCYAGTSRLLNARRAKRQFDVAFIDQSDQAMVEMALARSPKLVLIGTPSNPLMRVVDIRLIAARAKEAGAKIVVDNTFLSPALQLPIRLDADLVVHSTTKFLNGHSDVVGGGGRRGEPNRCRMAAALGQRDRRHGLSFPRFSRCAGYALCSRASKPCKEQRLRSSGFSVVIPTFGLCITLAFRIILGTRSPKPSRPDLGQC
jgi:cystathionine beta-lyase/cystathionine gamma-synthase